MCASRAMRARSVGAKVSEQHVCVRVCVCVLYAVNATQHNTLSMRSRSKWLRLILYRSFIFLYYVIDIYILMDNLYFNMAPDVYNVQCTMYNVRRTLYGVHCAIYDVQCSIIHGIQCTLYAV